MGDLNADNRADVIWRNANSGGDGGVFNRWFDYYFHRIPGSASTDWAIHSVGDVNGDPLA